jgi:aspartate/tyrosine/aromatic aminotransferase
MQLMFGMDFFNQVVEFPLDPILGLNISYAADQRKNKVDLGAGVYKTSDHQSFILNSVKKAETILLETEKSKDYLPIDGLPDFLSCTKALVFGSDFPFLYGAQTAGATAALSVGGRFLKQIGLSSLYLSAPTWANHKRVFQDAGLDIHTYSYFDWKTKGLAFDPMIEEIKKMPERSIILLQVCCHNPTGIDPTLEQWEILFDLFQKRGLFPFFDLSYQGFGKSVEEDAAPLALFLKRGLPCAVAVSNAKNFGIYGERCGALFIACSSAQEQRAVGSQIKMIIRSLYSNPPCHGARIVSTILQREELSKQWRGELAAMSTRISETRKALALGLQAKTGSARFDYLLSQKGMFSYTGLSEPQVERLISDYAIYLPSDGRINVAGLNGENLDYVIDAIIAVTNHF